MSNLMKDLRHLPTAVQQAVAACKSAKKPSEACAALSTCVGFATKTHDNVRQLFSGAQSKDLRNAMLVLSNTLSGVSDGIDSRDMSRKEMLRVLNNVGSMTDRYSDSLDAFAQRIRDKQQATAESFEEGNDEDEEDELEERRKLARVREIQDREGSVVRELHQLRQKLNKLPRKLSQPYVVARNPVVPIFDKFIPGRQSKLEQRGIKVLALEDHMVLDDQYLLLIDKSFVKKNKLDLEEYAEYLLAQFINPNSSIKFGLMSKTFQAVPRAPQLIAFWILPLNKKFGGFEPGAATKWSLLTFSDDDVHEKDLENLQEKERQSEQVEKNRVQRARLTEEQLKLKEKQAKEQAQAERRNKLEVRRPPSRIRSIHR